MTHEMKLTSAVVVSLLCLLVAPVSVADQWQSVSGDSGSLNSWSSVECE